MKISPHPQVMQVAPDHPCTLQVYSVTSGFLPRAAPVGHQVVRRLYSQSLSWILTLPGREADGLSLPCVVHI